MIQEPYELIVFLNEATYQVNLLAQKMGGQEDMVLADLLQAPGFKSAILFPEIILEERNRISKFQHTSLLMKGLGWVQSKVLGSKTQDFFFQWSEILNSIEQNIVTQSKQMVSKIILNLEHNLVQEIKDTIFNLPKSFLSELFGFIQFFIIEII